MKLRAPGRPTIILPGNCKDLSPVVLKTTAKTLGYPNADTMLERLGC